MRIRQYQVDFVFIHCRVIWEELQGLLIFYHIVEA